MRHFIRFAALGVAAAAIVLADQGTAGFQRILDGILAKAQEFETLAALESERRVDDQVPPGWQRVLDDIFARTRESTKPEPRTSAAAPRLERPARPEIRYFVRHFTGEGRVGFQVATTRLKRYRPMMERIFQEEKVPRQFLWVGLVESGYDPKAVSPMKAKGIWQFIPSTAARFGLIRQGRDLRSHPVFSTRAAARYLRLLYDQFGDWNLALAAYNAGEGRVAKAIRRAGTRDFWTLGRRGLLPRETWRYVPAVLAAPFVAGENRVRERVRPDAPKTGESPRLTPAAVMAPMTFSD
jgi:hypothetical protein